VGVAEGDGVPEIAGGFLLPAKKCASAAASRGNAIKRILSPFTGFFFSGGFQCGFHEQTLSCPRPCESKAAQLRVVHLATRSLVLVFSPKAVASLIGSNVVGPLPDVLRPVLRWGPHASLPV
jgi:hypothetical protein